MKVYTSVAVHVNDENDLYMGIREIHDSESNTVVHSLSFGLPGRISVFMTDKQIDDLEQIIKAYKSNNYRGNVNNRVPKE